MHASHGKLDRYDVLLAVCVRVQRAVVKLKKVKKDGRYFCSFIFPNQQKVREKYSSFCMHLWLQTCEELSD